MTGSNMSGKSTLLRAIGLNTVLAQAGSCACARQCDCRLAIFRPVFVCRTLSNSGSRISWPRSRGSKASSMRREPAAQDRVLLYLLDEILQGTNSAERGIAVRAVTRHLLDAGAIGVMTTHDLNIAGEEPLKSSAVLVHFTETVDDRGTMRSTTDCGKGSQHLETRCA